MKHHLEVWKYEGHEVQVWQADDVWHYQVAITTSAPLPALREGGFKNVEQAVLAAIALIESEKVFWRNG